MLVPGRALTIAKTRKPRDVRGFSTRGERGDSNPRPPGPQAAARLGVNAAISRSFVEILGRTYRAPIAADCGRSWTAQALRALECLETTPACVASRSRVEGRPLRHRAERSVLPLRTPRSVSACWARRLLSPSRAARVAWPRQGASTRTRRCRRSANSTASATTSFQARGGRPGWSVSRVVPRSDQSLQRPKSLGRATVAQLRLDAEFGLRPRTCARLIRPLQRGPPAPCSARRKSTRVRRPTEKRF
ncbi:MAG: hypothetical protein JWR63_517 [Conexibacter sp.]|nr:hypothetical protein [Conexibacter sp.]